MRDVAVMRAGDHGAVVVQPVAPHDAAMRPVSAMRLVCRESCADVRVAQIRGRSVASADTPNGPSLVLGRYPMQAQAHAFEPIDRHLDDLLATVPQNSTGASTGVPT